MHSDHEPLPALTADELEATIPEYRGQLKHWDTIPATPGEFVDPHSILPTRLADPFIDHIGDLYTHQAEAVAHLAAGDNVCVTTSTSSGKTYIYALHIARNHLENPDATALLVYPSKALARDQEQELNTLFDELGVGVTVRVYDGDTPTDKRPHIRETADVIITNFVGLNVYLEHHPQWRPVLSNCRILAIDESHTYTGVHGMHVAWTIRRLRRLLAHYGSTPQVVCTSATIGNPAEHSERLTGVPVTVVDTDGSPRGRRDIAFWKPPMDDRILGADPDYEDYMEAQASPTREASQLLAHLGVNGARTLLFTRSRHNAELAAKYSDRAASDHPTPGRIDVAAYHAGLGKKTRRGIEHRFRTGRLDGVTSTNALELGIDIGSIDATILTGYPGTRQSFWQQVGRSGRGETDALSVLVARADAIDQYIVDHPEYVLGDSIEDAVIGLDNNPVFAQHILCAADELPLTDADRDWFDRDRLEQAIDMWKAAGKLAGTLAGGVQYTGPPRPQAEISMYTTSNEKVAVRCENGEIDIEPLDRERAFRDHHEGALFLHNGAQYEVVEFHDDTRNPYIVVREVQTTEYTVTSSEKQVRDLDAEATRTLGDGYRVRFGTGTVSIHYAQYQRKDYRTGAASGLRPTGLEPLDLDTQLLWIETPAELQDTVLESITGRTTAEVSDGDVRRIFGGGLHGAEHGMIKLTPLELRLDTSDLGGLSTVRHPETEVPTWFIHDAVQGGLGFSRRIFDRVGRIAERTRDRVSRCSCTGPSGCPSCIMDSQCGNRNRYLHSGATVAVLDQVLDRL